MIIIIQKDKKISDIQKEFHKRFPHLKIEFYKSPHSEFEGSAVDNILDTELTIEQAQKRNASGTIKIEGLMTVAELEQAFAETFGLCVQVFRQSGQIWLQTTASDSWTLAEQNQKGFDHRDPSPETIIDAKDLQDLE
ncbi:MAG: hypothetical protein HOP11_01080 [Saprospiraceae bacterium]|nr:hypothetical protein [Saprospiraceae bacterium]